MLDFSRAPLRLPGRDAPPVSPTLRPAPADVLGRPLLSVVGLVASLVLGGCADSNAFVVIPSAGHDASSEADVAETHADQSSPTDLGADVAAQDSSADANDASEAGLCGVMVSATCDLFGQDCPGTGTCAFDVGLGTVACSDRTVGTALEAASCSSHTDCARGLTCLGGRCTRPCCKEASAACGPSGTCSLAVYAEVDAGLTTPPDGGLHSVVHYACRYGDPCHPFAFDCPTGQVCVTAGTASWCVARGESNLGAPPNGPCTTSADCGESQACLEVASAGMRCLLLCNLEGTPTSPPAPANGRFPADGTCSVSSQSFGRCSATEASLPGALGVCLP